MDSRVSFKVSLSNGETLYENKGVLESKPGELSSINKLLGHIESKDANITSLSLIIDGKETSLPSSGNNPHFKAFHDGSKPLGYNIYRKYGQNVIGGTSGRPDRFVVIETEYDSMSVQLWANEDAPHQQYINIVSK